MVIGLDIDGTVVYHRYPNMGEELPHCIDVLKRCIEHGHHIVVNTMRSGRTLKDAVNFLHDKGLILYGINQNPTQRDWTTSPKIHADIYIDDLGLNAPLKYDDSHPYLDWYEVEKILEKKGFFK